MASTKKSTKKSIKNIQNIPTIPVKQKFNHYRPFRVSVEGNIGCGKTTILNHFSQFSDVETYAEPIDWWRNLEGYNLLDLLYKDINKWYHVFQKYVQLTRVQMQTMPPKYASTTTQMFERSIQVNRHTFVEHAISSGYLKGPELEVFDQWYKWLIENIDVEIDFIVYLRTNPEVVFERIKNRGRTEESVVPFQYVKELHEFHEKWLIQDPESVIKNKILIIDANQPLENVLKQCEENQSLVLREKMVLKTTNNKMF